MNRSRLVCWKSSDKLRARGSHNFTRRLCAGATHIYGNAHAVLACAAFIASCTQIALLSQLTAPREKSEPTYRSIAGGCDAMYCSTQDFGMQSDRESYAAAAMPLMHSRHKTRASLARFDFVLHTPRARDVQLT
jgi:hypothetical protein